MQLNFATYTVNSDVSFSLKCGFGLLWVLCTLEYKNYQEKRKKHIYLIYYCTRKCRMAELTLCVSTSTMYVLYQPELQCCITVFSFWARNQILWPVLIPHSSGLLVLFYKYNRSLEELQETIEQSSLHNLFYISPAQESYSNAGMGSRGVCHNHRLLTPPPLFLYTVKKGYRFSRPQPGCNLPKSIWPGII